MTLNDDETKDIVPAYGLSFADAIKSTPEIWEKRMIDEDYEGDANSAGKLMAKLCEGMRYGQKMLDESHFRGNGKPLPRVDFGYMPQVPGIVHSDEINTIIAPNHYLKLFEDHEPTTMVEMIDSVDKKNSPIQRNS